MEETDGILLDENQKLGRSSQEKKQRVYDAAPCGENKAIKQGPR